MCGCLQQQHTKKENTKKKGSKWYERSTGTVFKTE